VLARARVRNLAREQAEALRSAPEDQGVQRISSDIDRILEGGLSGDPRLELSLLALVPALVKRRA